MPADVDVVCAGIIVADHVCAPIPRLPNAGELITADNMILAVGGCAANAAVGLARMKARAAVVGRVGDDGFGAAVVDMLRLQNVATDAVVVSRRRPTSQTMIVNVAGQDRRFIHMFGANGDFTAADIPLDRVLCSRVLYVGGYFLLPALMQADLVPIFAAAQTRGVRTVLDVALPGPGEYLSQIERLLPHVDVFLPNEQEAAAILGVTDPMMQAETFHRLGAGVAVVTCGGEGAALSAQGLRLRSGVYPVEVVDGSGAGDAFDAGFIYGLLHRLDLEDCLRIASALGASCVRSLGTTAGVFREDECREFIRTHHLAIERM